MTSVSDIELEANLAAYLDSVCDSRAPLTVTRETAGNIVMLAEGEYEALLETVHLLHSPANAARLLRSIADADAGALIEHDLVDDPKPNADHAA